MTSKSKKRGHTSKEGKKAHHLTIAPGMTQPPMSLQAPVLQPAIQIKQQHMSPAGYLAPQVTALESSQMLENTFDSLPHFSQSLLHLPHHTNDSSSPAPPHLTAHSAGGPGSPDTHPFLNQHAILQNPGKLEPTDAVLIVTDLIRASSLHSAPLVCAKMLTTSVAVRHICRSIIIYRIYYSLYLNRCTPFKVISIVLLIIPCRVPSL